MRIGSPHYAYLKIAEGCNNPCRFCAIPRMRGLQVSRPVEAIVAEAHELIATGAKEILLIAQDTTSYGQDLYGKHELAKLLRTLSASIKEDVWLRLMYAYPKHLTAEMLDALAADPRYCRYIDMPLQHAHDEMLAAMARGVTQDQTRRLLDLIDTKLPGCAVRTTFIVGFPGETQAHVDAMRDFIAEGRFTHAGVFMYSTEPLTPAAKLPDALTLVEKQRRRDELYKTQLEVSRRRLSRRVGEEAEVLVDGPVEAGRAAPKGALQIARTRSEAPEVDGLVYLKGRAAEALEPGTRVRVRIAASFDYDLAAEVLPSSEKNVRPRRKSAHKTRA
jgi:ribosomal protein S12 methylthiotransferase